MKIKHPFVIQITDVKTREANFVSCTTSDKAGVPEITAVPADALKFDKLEEAVAAMKAFPNWKPSGKEVEAKELRAKYDQ
jgi:hypothetical protein